jgi:putative NADPH-quinone reductase
MPPTAAARRILLIEGHPEAGARHLNHVLADAYADGAEAGGHTVRRVVVAELDFPLLRSAQD